MIIINRTENGVKTVQPLLRKIVYRTIKVVVRTYRNRDKVRQLTRQIANKANLRRKNEIVFVTFN